MVLHYFRIDLGHLLQLFSRSRNYFYNKAYFFHFEFFLFVLDIFSGGCLFFSAHAGIESLYLESCK